MIHQLNFNGQDKVEVAIERLKTYEPEEGYFLCFSGGKDSCVIKALADMAGVKYDAHYAVASVDPPELVRFIKDEHPDVIFDYPRYKDGTVCTMWNLIPKKTMPPTKSKEAIIPLKDIDVELLAHKCLCGYAKEDIVKTIDLMELLVKMGIMQNCIKIDLGNAYVTIELKTERED